ncbi:MAG: PAS domain S-box protein, partial [Promethearchaeota archaeon]
MKKLPFSAEELLFILEKAQFIVFIWKNEINWPVEYVSENISQLGYSCEDFFSGKIKYSDLIHPDDIERVKKEVKKYSVTLTPEFQQEYRILNNLNQIIWVHDRTIIKTDKNGKITHYQGFIFDITKEKEMQEQLQESMQKYQELIDQAKSIILRLDENLIITFANDFAIKFFGFSEEELVGHIVSDTIIPKRDSEGKDLLKMISLIKKKPKSHHNNINENIKKNGERVWISWTNNALYDKNGNKKGFLTIGNDITDLRKAEQA